MCLTCFIYLFFLLGSTEGIIIPALGRTVPLGTVYNLRTGTFGVESVLAEKLEAGGYTELPSPDTQISVVTADSRQAKMNLLEASASVQVALFAGMFKVEGGGQYLTEKQEASVKTEIVYASKFKTVNSRLNYHFASMGSKLYYSFLEEATHFVGEIQYGANVYVSFKHSRSNAVSVDEIKGYLGLSGGFGPMQLSGKGAIGYKMAEEDMESSLQIEVHADVPVLESVTSFEDVRKFVADIPRLLSATNGGKGKPVQYKLVPLSKIIKAKKRAEGFAQNVSFVFDGDLDEEETVRDSATKAADSLANSLLLYYYNAFDDIGSHMDSLTRSYAQPCVLVSKTRELNVLATRYSFLRAKFQGKVEQYLTTRNPSDEARDAFYDECSEIEEELYQIKSQAHNPSVVEKIKRYEAVQAEVGMKYFGRGGSFLYEEVTRGTSVFAFYIPASGVEDDVFLQKMNHLRSIENGTKCVVDCEFDHYGCKMISEPVIKHFSHGSEVEIDATLLQPLPLTDYGRNRLTLLQQQIHLVADMARRNAAAKDVLEREIAARNFLRCRGAGNATITLWENRSENYPGGRTEVIEINPELHGTCCSDIHSLRYNFKSYKMNIENCVGIALYEEENCNGVPGRIHYTAKEIHGNFIAGAHPLNFKSIGICY